MCKGINTGSQSIYAKLYDYTAEMNFDVTPVEFEEIEGDTFLMGSNIYPDEKTHKVFADWAPEEDTEEADDYLNKLRDQSSIQ